MSIFLKCVKHSANLQGNDIWHWQCSDEIGQPTDVTQIVPGGKLSSLKMNSKFECP